MRTLNKYTGEEVILSPSALNTYIDCRLRFYFQNLQGIREPEEREDEISPRVLGNFLHRAMEFLYQGLEAKKGSKWVDPGDFEWLNSQVDRYLKEALGQELAKDRTHIVDYSGTLRVVEEVVKIYIEEVLKQDKRWAPFEMVDQEWKIAHPVQLEVEGRKLTIRLGGFIDRLDRKDGVYRIIDYKTGGDKKDLRSVQDLFSRDRTDRNKAALQTLLYAELLGKQLEQAGKSGTAPAWLQAHVGAARVQAGLYTVRQMRSEGAEFDWRFSENSTKRKMDDNRIKEIGPELMDSIQAVLVEIFNKDQPFDQTERREKCEYCPYQTICGR
jgi:ATP-dependent helicase/DNAse subunit B